jgi:hypothetical protein
MVLQKNPKTFWIQDIEKVIIVLFLLKHSLFYIFCWIEMDYPHQQWLVQSGKSFKPLKQVVGSSISRSYICKEFGWEEGTLLVCPIGFPMESANNGVQTSYIYCGNPKKRLPPTPIRRKKQEQKPQKRWQSSYQLT